MKRILSLFLGLCLIIVVFVGCSGKINTTDSKTTQNSSQENEQPPETKLQEEVVKPQIEHRGILGSHYQDARLGLEERGFPKKSLGESELMECKTYENTMEDADTGVQYNCSLFIEQDNTVISAIFDIINPKPLETKDFIKVATNYLKYSASMPYDTMDADKVNKWIDENIDKVDSGDKGASIIIGDAEFLLYGTEAPSGIAGTRLLEIRKTANIKK